MYNNMLNTPAYSFLKSERHLGDQILYLTLSGSIGYGTNLEASDIDLRGFAIERKEVLFGFSDFEQFEEKETDTVIYGLKKFIQLAIKANPNILELLGTKPGHLVYMHPLGQKIRENRELFLSKRVADSFGNFATAQLRRLENALARDQYPQDEKEKHILKSLNRQFKHFETHYRDMDKLSLTLEILETGKSERPSEIVMNLEAKQYPLRDFVGIYSEMNNLVKDYDRLNHRNNKKDDKAIRKHAMHLLRLLIMGTEILETHEINTYREKEHDLLMQIRNGVMPMQTFYHYVSEYEEKFEEAAAKTTLPPQPDLLAIEKLQMEIYEAFY